MWEVKDIKPLLSMSDHKVAQYSQQWEKIQHYQILNEIRKGDFFSINEPNFDYSVIINTNNIYSLPYSLLSSYSCYFFELKKQKFLNPFHWVGIISPFTDINVVQLSPTEILVGSDNMFSFSIINYLKDAIGLWKTNYQTPKDELLQNISTLYPGLSIPNLNENLLDLLISVLCSQHTKIENARKWFHFLKKYYRRLDPVINMDPNEIMKESKIISGKSMGYRARYIKATLNELTSNGFLPEENLRSLILDKNEEKIRRDLINLRFIGPKTADCFLLNAIKTTKIPPIDVNVRRVINRLDNEFTLYDLPKSRYCRNYVCNLTDAECCPIFIETQESIESNNKPNQGCLRAAIKIKYEDPGWVQALIFLYGLEFCKPTYPRCINCYLKDKCEGPKITPRKKRTYLPRNQRTRTRKKQLNYVKILDTSSENEQVENKAQLIVQECYTNNILIPKQNILAASFWIAARNERIPITLAEVASSYDLQKKQLFKTISKIKTGLSIKIERIATKEYVQYFAKKLGLKKEITDHAESIIKNIIIRQGISPNGITASSLYIASIKFGLSISKKKISKTCGISEVTLRKNIERILTNC